MIDLYKDPWACEDLPVDVKKREIFFITAQSAGFVIDHYLREALFSDHRRISSFGINSYQQEPHIEALLITYLDDMKVIPFSRLMKLMRRAVKQRKTN